MAEFASVVLRLAPTTIPKAGRGGPPYYMPHFRVGPSGEYLGVGFLEGPEWIQPGEEVEEVVALMYTDTGVDYSPLQPGVRFQVLEGATVVGEGTVLRRWTEPNRPWNTRPTA